MDSRGETSERAFLSGTYNPRANHEKQIGGPEIRSPHYYINYQSTQRVQLKEARGI
jgi:hypothetical protein